MSAVTGFVLAQYYSVDVLASLTGVAEDCWLDWGVQIGRHCFSDYAITVDEGMQANPWGPYPTFLPWDNYQAGWVNYPAAALVPQLLFAVPAKLLGAPYLGLFAFLFVLTIAVLRAGVLGCQGGERPGKGGACSWRWAPPPCRRGRCSIEATRWGSSPRSPWFSCWRCAESDGAWSRSPSCSPALLKPQFVILAVALFASRQWRLGGAAVGGAVIANLGAYLLWPRDFPQNIVQSVKGVFGYGGSPYAVTSPYNVSFASGLFHITNRVAPMFGYGVLIVVVVCVLVLGRRVPAGHGGHRAAGHGDALPVPGLQVLSGVRTPRRRVGGSRPGRSAGIGHLRSRRRPVTVVAPSESA